MKKLICGVLAASVVALAGCSLLSSDSAVKSALLSYAEKEGKAKASAYIDQMVTDGKITADQGEKLKAALVEGIEKLKEEINKEGIEG